MRKKIIYIVLILCLTIGFGVRFYFVNKDVDIPIVQVYEKGEVVPFGNDFTDYSDEIIDGYTAQILGSEILTPEAFLQKYDSSGEYAVDDITFDGMTTYFYVVTVSFGNIDNQNGEEMGVNLQMVDLMGTNYTALIDEAGYQIANPDVPWLGFSLRVGTTKEFVLPYAVVSETVGSYDHLLKDLPKLQITAYPHQKLLKVN